MNSEQIAQGTSQALQNMQVGSRLPFGDILAWTYWDTISFLSTTTSFNMFQSQMGVGTTNPPSKTNMRAAGVIPAGQKMTVEAIKLQIIAPAALATAAMIALNVALDNATMTIRIPGKDSTYECSLVEAFGSPYNMIGTPTVAGNSEYNSLSIARGIVKLRKAIVLAAQQPFGVEIRFDVATLAAIDGVKLKVELAGILERMA
jgi:hypothetical protein